MNWRLSMKRLLSRGAVPAVALALMTSQAIADEYVEVEPIEVSASILAVTNSLSEQGVVEHLEYADLDGDLDPEAFMIMTMGPNPENPDYREWRVIDDIDGMGIQIGTWYGEDVQVVITPPVRRGDPDIGIINSDGSYWYLYKEKMRPYGDIISTRTKYIHEGLAGDENLFASFGQIDVPLRYMARLTLDLTDAHGDEVLTSLRGEGFWRESDGATPYVLTSSTGEEIFSGWSLAYPSIFKLSGGGFQIIEAINGSYRAIYFPESDTE
jgi:hypothetical protein